MSKKWRKRIRRVEKIARPIAEAVVVVATGGAGSALVAAERGVDAARKKRVEEAKAKKAADAFIAQRIAEKKKMDDEILSEELGAGGGASFDYGGLLKDISSIGTSAAGAYMTSQNVQRSNLPVGVAGRAFAPIRPMPPTSQAGMFAGGGLSTGAMIGLAVAAALLIVLFAKKG
jgi:hypothetical protein